MFTKGAALRSLFVVGLIHGTINDAKSLWERFEGTICDDVPWRLRNMRLPEADLTDHAARVTDFSLYLVAKLLEEYSSHYLGCTLGASTPRRLFPRILDWKGNRLSTGTP